MEGSSGKTEGRTPRAQRDASPGGAREERGGEERRESKVARPGWAAWSEVPGGARRGWGRGRRTGPESPTYARARPAGVPTHGPGADAAHGAGPPGPDPRRRGAGAGGVPGAAPPPQPLCSAAAVSARLRSPRPSPSLPAAAAAAAAAWLPRPGSAGGRGGGGPGIGCAGRLPQPRTRRCAPRAPRCAPWGTGLSAGLAPPPLPALPLPHLGLPRVPAELAPGDRWSPGECPLGVPGTG